MYKFLVLHSISMNQTLGLRLPDIWTTWKNYMCREIKMYSANVVF